MECWNLSWGSAPRRAKPRLRARGPRHHMVDDINPARSHMYYTTIVPRVWYVLVCSGIQSHAGFLSCTVAAAAHGKEGLEGPRRREHDAIWFPLIQTPQKIKSPQYTTNIQQRGGFATRGGGGFIPMLFVLARPLLGEVFLDLVWLLLDGGSVEAIYMWGV